MYARIIYPLSIHPSLPACGRAGLHACMHTYIHAYIPTHLPTYLPTYIHNYILLYIPRSLRAVEFVTDGFYAFHVGNLPHPVACFQPHTAAPQRWPNGKRIAAQVQRPQSLSKDGSFPFCSSQEAPCRMSDFSG